MTGRVLPGPWERPSERRQVTLDALEWGLILTVLDETGGVSASMAARLIRRQLADVAKEADANYRRLRAARRIVTVARARSMTVARMRDEIATADDDAEVRRIAYRKLNQFAGPVLRTL